jgi:hypothetical protein
MNCQSFQPYHLSNTNLIITVKRPLDLILSMYLDSAGQNQVDPPESVSHEIKDKVSVHTEIFVGA